MDQLDELFQAIAAQKKQPQKQEVKKPKPPTDQNQSKLRFELTKLDFVKLTQENLYSRMPNQNTMMQFENDRCKYQISNLIGDEGLYADKIETKGFLIGKYEKPFKIKNQTESAIHPIKNNLDRQLKVFKKQIKDLTWESVQPMNRLWNLYMANLISKDNNVDNVYARILKADLHGCLIQILHSKSVSYEGLEGIVVAERLKSLIILTEGNKLKTIFKEHSIFLIPLEQKTYKIYGCHLVFRAADRSKIKFKYHQANDFVYSKL